MSSPLVPHCDMGNVEGDDRPLGGIVRSLCRMAVLNTLPDAMRRAGALPRDCTAATATAVGFSSLQPARGARAARASAASFFRVSVIFSGGALAKAPVAGRRD